MQSDSKQAVPVRAKCPDCKMCQNCSEVRCLACREGKKCGNKRKLSIQEQIALFDSLNTHLKTASCCTSEDCHHDDVT